MGAAAERQDQLDQANHHSARSEEERHAQCKYTLASGHDVRTSSGSRYLSRSPAPDQLSSIRPGGSSCRADVPH